MRHRPWSLSSPQARALREELQAERERLRQAMQRLEALQETPSCASSGPTPRPFLNTPQMTGRLLRATAAYHEARKTRTMGFHSIDPNPKTDQIDEGVFCFNRLPAFDWGNHPSRSSSDYTQIQRPGILVKSVPTGMQNDPCFSP